MRIPKMRTENRVAVQTGVDIHKEGDTLKVNIDPLYN